MPVDGGSDQPVGRLRRQQNVVDADSIVLGPGASLVIPEGEEARFVAPHVLEVGGHQLRSERIVLAVGSRPSVPEIEGLADVSFHTTDTIMRVDARPELFAEFMKFLKSLPETSVPFAIAPRLAGLGSTAERRPQVVQLLTQWREGGNGQLKKTAATALDQLST